MNDTETAFRQHCGSHSLEAKSIQTFLLCLVAFYVSLFTVKIIADARKRDQLAARLPDATHILRGSLLERIIRHRTGCPKCDRGEGHPVAVLAVGYPGKVTRQISLRKEQVADVERCLANYQKLKAAIEEICELNQQLLRAEPADRDDGGKAK
jgi:hypothetical protein